MGIESPFRSFSARQLVMVLPLLTAMAPVAERAAAQTLDGTMGVVNIKGRAIQRLELVQDTNRVVKLDQLGDSISLPLGRYRVRTVHLRGGYYGRGNGTEDSWFTVMPGKPTQLDVGAPLTLNITPSRWGRVITLNYELVDGMGLRYLDAESRELPKFAVSKGGKTIGSGSFEYG